MELNQQLTIPIILLLSVLCSQAHAQTHTVSGTVTADGKPLSGVTVSEEGRDVAAVTGASGTYQLTVQGEQPVLLFRHPSFGERREEIGSQTVFDLSPDEKVSEIKEVVLNAGYYEVKAKESTGSISKVTAKDIENQPVTNVLSAVQGRMAGVNITQNSGVPGGGYDVQIRGRNSLRNMVNSLNDGNSPLYIVDGVPWAVQLSTTYSAGIIPVRSISPLNSINPNDIESIEVLKDADATAIYGSRGGNGVILITTKKGKSGPVRVTLNSSQSYSRATNRLQMMNTADYITMRRQAYANVGVTALPANAYDINGSWDTSRYTDWQKALTGETAEQLSVQLSVAGGSEKNSFSVSAGHQDQTSVFPGDQHYKVNTIAASYSHRSADRKFTLGLSNTFSAAVNNNLATDFTNRALSLSPNAPALYDAEGNLNWQNNTFNNPLAQLNASYLNEVKTLSQNLNVGYKPLTDITVKLNTGFTLQDLEEYSLIPNTAYSPASASGAGPASSSASRGTSAVFSYLLEPQVSWKKQYGNHSLEVLAGMTFQESRSKLSAMRGTGFASNALMQNIAAATNITLSDFSDTRYRYAAFFGRANWQYKERYILNLTARRDGSSRFGPSDRFADFGALGAAWILSEEPFLKEIPWLSLAKLRGSIGRTGSDAIGDFQYEDTYTLGSSSYNGIPGLYPSRLYNPGFSWEKTDKLEAAAELAFWKDRLQVTAAWYRNRSSNQLIGIPLPTTTGFTSILANLGATVENSGMEVEVAGTPLKGQDWKWSVGFNISMPRNRLLAFPGLEGSTYANTYVVGESIYAVKLLDYQGISPATGQYQFTDYNKDGKISTPDDAQALRTLGPEYFGGFQNSFTYRNLSFSFLLQFVKQENWNYIRTMSTPGVMVNQPTEFLNVWSATNPGGIIMPYTPGTNAVTNTLTANFKNSTAAVGDASFIRLKNFQLNYRIPVRTPVLREVSLYVQGQNLWTWTKYFGADPEFITSGFLPPLKTVSMGMQLTF
ncbi:SusC/RagA family TonB-linked outer membrane protein [Chryseobacterium sp.]|uniref:SusC/RagA family TonB-linked outer membrane protein n=1 Tax=Chryseobacterium sp. TaxID=1871047 RepID=UPI0011CB4B4F|nr:SusC/RagA family TonB-linked outer membrane protein [Chryseobacterium sp.]TXF79623.1 SusC/RagA family TonB-linked outer membrane protein [Chryseobacterium sp.]